MTAPPAEFSIFKTGKKLLFSEIGPELHFDDVVDMIDKVEDELEQELKTQAGDFDIQKTRGWNLETARLSVSNPNKYDGLTHRSLLQFLKGLREVGFLYGFFEAKIVFYDDWQTISIKGTGMLETNKPH